MIVITYNYKTYRIPAAQESSLRNKMITGEPRTRWELELTEALRAHDNILKLWSVDPRD